MERLRVFWEKEVFPQERPKDVVWLPKVANRGWVAITQDHLDGPEEQLALVQHGVKVFVLVGQVDHAALAALFLKNIKWVRKKIATHDEAFLAKIYCEGSSPKVIPASDLLARCSRRLGC
jgi:hypothetical protein